MTSDDLTWIKAHYAKEYAETARSARRQMDSLQEVVAANRMCLDGVGAQRYDTDGRGHGMAHGDDRTAALVIALTDSISRSVDAMREWASVADEFSACCDLLDGRHSQLLRLRYALGRTWADVADAMDYTVDYCKGDLNDSALAALHDVMPVCWRMPRHVAEE